MTVEKGVALVREIISFIPLSQHQAEFVLWSETDFSDYFNNRGEMPESLLRMQISDYVQTTNDQEMPND